MPSGGLAAMGGDRAQERERRELADLLRVTMLESGDLERPTIVIQDQGTGQHPDDFPHTLVSLLASNKKSATHQMGVYNAGGAASFKFAKATVVASRLAPTLRRGRSDEVGITIVRYDPLDPDKYKSGVYQYMAARDGSIVRLNIRELPNLPHGTYIKLLEYLVPRYARAAYEPKRSLWHLFHAALPDPALPIRIIETRAGQFPGVRGDQERRVVAGLQNLLSRAGSYGRNLWTSLSHESAAYLPP